VSHGTYAGIDLHASTNYIEMIDEHDRRPYAKTLPNRLRAVLSALGPFKDSLAGVVLESTLTGSGWAMDLKSMATRYISPVH
jgi:hypothetical protein